MDLTEGIAKDWKIMQNKQIFWGNHEENSTSIISIQSISPVGFRVLSETITTGKGAASTT